VIVYPAIDIREGKVVRLFQGDPDQQTVHADDPLGVARQWRDAGAAWLHVVNLDGAFGEESTTLALVRQMAELGIPIQFGGGLRSLDAMQQAIAAGVTRLVLGTIAVREPQTVAEAVTRFGAEAVAVALDAKEGKVATHGWQQTSDLTPVELGKRFAAMGVRYALYTDISRDGALTGVNVTATQELAEQTGLEVIASGGVATLDDVYAVRAAGLNGVVIGKALYNDTFTLQQALNAAKEA
jgi:phosphoribosylformimino-5-aminoimidazole carboxamide ribotide isomerase